MSVDERRGIALQDFQASEGSRSSTSDHRTSSSAESSRDLAISSEDTLLHEDARLAVPRTPCALPSKRFSFLWKMHSNNHNGSNLEESASLLNDPSEKVAEFELKETPISQQQQSLFENASNSVQGVYRSPRAFLRTVLRGMIPSFLTSRSSGEPEKLYPTAYLDGMRGLAAFAVFLCHLSYTLFAITHGYGQVDVFKEGEEIPDDSERISSGKISRPGDNERFIQLPFIRLLYSGPPMVAIFFIISGYALSNKPIKQMRSRSFEGLLGTMCSSIFRRGFRLFLPCFASTFLVFFMVRIGLYELTRELYENKKLFPNVDEAHCPRGDNFTDQFVHWIRQMWDFVHPWEWFIFGGSTIYDRHLWTIPVEFRASLVLFLSLVGLAKFKAHLRMMSYVGLSIWALCWNRWEMVLFWFGSLFAEMDIIKAQAGNGQDLPTANGSANGNHLKSRLLRGPQMPPRLWSAFWIANVVCGCYLCSYPDEQARSTPGFVILASMIPKWYAEKYRFWQSFGALQIVWACTNAKFLQRLFTGPVVQYLGKISYALYLMHGPVIHTFGFGMMGVFWNIFGSETRTQWEMGFAMAAILTIFAVVWAADIFWRAVDIPCVKFARWLEGKVTIAGSGR